MNVTQEQVSVLKEFTRWGRFPSELRHHALSYYDGQSLFNYSQCSKLCNREVKRFDTESPKWLTLKDENTNDLVVMLCYTNRQTGQEHKIKHYFIDENNERHKWVVYPAYHDERPRSNRVYQTDQSASYEGAVMRGALRFLERRFRHATPADFKIRINTDRWPVEFNTLLKDIHRSGFNILPTDGSYEGLMQFMEDAPANMMVTFEPRDANNLFHLPSEFASSQFFQNLKTFHCLLPMTITDDQFLGFRAKLLRLKHSTVSARAINQKLAMWHADENCFFEFAVLVTLRPNNWDPVLGALPFRRISSNVFKLTKRNRRTGKLTFIIQDEPSPFTAIWFTEYTGRRGPGLLSTCMYDGR